MYMYTYVYVYDLYFYVDKYILHIWLELFVFWGEGGALQRFVLLVWVHVGALVILFES